MATLTQWYEKGMTYRQYIDQMTVNKEEMLFNNTDFNPSMVLYR
ncbi:hypothetical protein NST54_03330 [Caldifermentibacillus hisashii]